MPLSFQVPPSLVAVASMPLSSHLPLGSVMARVAMVSPEAMPGRMAALAAASSATSRVLVASTTVEKNGAHSRARPISSSTTISST